MSRITNKTVTAFINISTRSVFWAWGGRGETKQNSPGNERSSRKTDDAECECQTITAPRIECKQIYMKKKKKNCCRKCFAKRKFINFSQVLFSNSRCWIVLSPTVIYYVAQKRVSLRCARLSKNAVVFRLLKSKYCFLNVNF